MRRKRITVAIDTGNLRREIEQKKLILEEKYAIAEVAARKVVECYKDLLIAEENRDFKNGSKEIARHEMAENAFKLSETEYFRFAQIYHSLLGEIFSLYEELINSDCTKGAKKARGEAKRFEERESYRKDRLSEIVARVSGVNEAYADYVSGKKNEDSHIDEAMLTQDIESGLVNSDFSNESTESTPQPEMSSRHVPADSVNVDVTRIVESAVALAMDKFNAVLEARTNKIIEDTGSNSPEQSPDRSESENILKLHSELVDFELEIAAKLSVLTEKLKNLSEDLIKIGVSCIELSNTQKEVAKAQKETADMQLALLQSAEELKQKQMLTTEEYSSAAAEQTALLERQMTSIEKQASLGERQAEIETLQKTILEAHTSLAEEAGEIFESQKQITEMQRTVSAAQMKNLEQQRALTEKQSELSILQKTAFSEHKQLKKKLKKK